MVYKAHEAIAATYAKRIRQVVEEELKNPGYLEKIKTLPHSKEATNVTALLFTKVLLMGMNHALGKKKKGHKFADGVDGEAADIRDVEVLPFEEAVEYMRARLPLDAKEYYKLADKARFRAFTVSLLADGDLLVKTKNMLAKNLEEGGGLKDFLVKTDTDLLKGVGMAGAGGGWYWETVYRTNVQTAYNVGRAIGFEAVPPVALELVGIGDARQTELCRNLTQPPVRRLYGDDFWKRFWPPLHFNCRTTVRAIYDEQELEEEPVTGIPADAEKHKSQGWGSYPLDSDKWWEELPSMKKRAQAYGVQGMIDRARKIIANRQMANGMRRSIFNSLSEEEKQFVLQEAEAIGIDKSYLVFRENQATGYSDSRDKIFIGADIFPSEDDSIHNRDKLSVRAVLAHEYYGHKRNRGTDFPQGFWEDEYRASYEAAKYAPNLTQEDRYRLILDALDRAKEAGIIIEKDDFIKEVLYGNRYE